MRSSDIIASLSGGNSTWLNSYYANGLLLAQSLGSSSYYYQDDALGSTRLVTSPTGAVLYSSDYLPYGASSGTSGTFTPSFEYTGKLVDDLTGLYYYGARFYSPETDRFITEDTSTGSLDDPLSLNTYIYARDDPEAITDPTGHDWWSSLTSAVSNTVNTVASDATSVGQDIVKAASNPENQAIVATAAIDIGTGAAIAATGGTILATPVGQAALGAAISSTAYTITEGSNAKMTGALESAGVGAVSGLAGFGIGNAFGIEGGSLLSLGAGHLLSAGLAVGMDAAEDLVTHSSFNYVTMGVDAGVASIGFGVGVHAPSIFEDSEGATNFAQVESFANPSWRDLHSNFISTGFAVGGSILDYAMSRYLK